MTADGTTAREEAGDWRPVLEQAGLGDLERVFAYAGGDDLAKPGLGHRRRTKLELVDSAGQRRALYLKRYGDEPWSWRLRRWWTYGPRMSPAKVEATNIHAAAEAGIATMRAVAFGQAPGAFQAGRSYIIVTSVPGDALSRTLNDFLYRHANDGAAGELALRLGSLAGRMHGAGLAHRDFYTAHVFLDERGATFELYLIDLARMFRPSRWRRRSRKRCPSNCAQSAEYRRIPPSS